MVMVLYNDEVCDDGGSGRSAAWRWTWMLVGCLWRVVNPPIPLYSRNRYAIPAIEWKPERHPGCTVDIWGTQVNS